MGLSFYWYIRLLAMALGSFELCMIVSNKNKRVSLLGMIIITFSSAVQWWYCLDNLIWAQIILVLFISRMANSFCIFYGSNGNLDFIKECFKL